MSYLVQFEAYLLTERRLSDNTLSAYISDLEQLQAFLCADDILIENATLQDHKRFLYYLTKDLMLNPRSVARKIASIKAFFAYIHKRHGVEDSAQDLHIPKIKKTIPVFLSEDEIATLLAYADRSKSTIGMRNKTMMYLLYVSGVRITELVQLNVSALRFDTGFITVRGKGDKERMIPLPAAMLDDLSYYIKHVRANIIASVNQTSDIQALFPSKYGGKLNYMTRQAFWVIVKNLCKGAGIAKNISPHNLRHSLATHLLKNGTDLRSLQMILGHENIMTVEIYTHVETTRLREEYDKKHPRSK